MRHFAASVTRVALLFVALALVIAALPVGNDYCAAFADKMTHLAEVPGARLIVVGGSGMAFGFDSQATERALGRPVINTGLHAGLGLEFMLDHVVDKVHPGDIVLVIPEYSILGDDFAGDDGIAAAALLTNFPSGLRFAEGRDLLPMLRGFSDYATHKLIADPLILWRNRHSGTNYDYSREGFDRWGDEVQHLQALSVKVDFHERYPISPEIGRRIQVLNDFERRMRRRGAMTVVLYPNLAASLARGNEANLEKIADLVSTELLARHVGRPLDGLLPDEDFFDAPYHLNAAGRATAAVRVIGQLKAALALPPQEAESRSR